MFVCSTEGVQRTLLSLFLQIKELNNYANMTTIIHYHLCTAVDNYYLHDHEKTNDDRTKRKMCPLNITGTSWITGMTVCDIIRRGRIGTDREGEIMHGTKRSIDSMHNAK